MVKAKRPKIRKAAIVVKPHVRNSHSIVTTLAKWLNRRKIDAFVEESAKVGEISAVARSGTVAVSKGEVTLTSFDRQHLLVG